MSDNKNVILVQGPNNKIISLKIKTPTTKTQNLIPVPNKNTIIKSQQDSSTLLSEHFDIKNTITTSSPSLVLQNKPIDTTTTTTTTIISAGQNEQQQPKLLRKINPTNLRIMPSTTKSSVGGNVTSSEPKAVTISKTYKKLPTLTPIIPTNLSLPNLSSNITISKADKMLIRNNISEPSPCVTIEKKTTSLIPSFTVRKVVLDDKQLSKVLITQMSNQEMKVVKDNENDNIKKSINEHQSTVTTSNPGISQTVVVTTTPMTEKSSKDIRVSKLKKLLKKSTYVQDKTTNQLINCKNILAKSYNNGNRTYNRVIKIKNIDNMMAKSSINKVKQQSLLKNKMLENVLRSPRTKGRSKSLNGVNSKQIKSRRTSTASDSKTKDLNSVNKELLLQIQEKIDEKKTMTTAAVSSASSNSLSVLPQLSTKSIEENKEKINNNKFLPNPPPLIRFDDLKLNLNSIRPPPIDTMKINPSSNNDLINVLKWNNGIGTTDDSLIAFHLNEYGLMEIYEKTVFRNGFDICYEKPIFQRESKSQNTSDYVDPLYFCKGCNCHGAAVDFLAPNYCSYECIARYDRKKSKQHHKNLHDKKLSTAYRKKRSLGFPNIRNWQQTKLIPVDENQTSELNKKQQTNNTELKTKRIFSWTTYLSSSNAEPATIDLFLNPFPCGPNLFEIDMKLEAIDPEHSSLFCVCTIVEKRGYRLKLHFDGFRSIHDFWVNADSMDIFPPGWCSKTNRFLQPPKDIKPREWSWSAYLLKTKSTAALRNLFTHLNSSSITNPFKVGMKFEADDLRNTRKVCVATVADVLDNRILVHFDGWDEGYDYWVDANSPYIHPVNWHKMNSFEIVAPPDWDGPFDWNTYIQQTNSIPAMTDLFQTRDPIDFQPGMKLEIVDKQNRSLIRPGTVIMRDEFELKVIFDGWPKEYGFWVADDNPDIHPIGWCEATGHDLESPPGFEGLKQISPCSMPGCRGIGNAKSPDIDFHTTIDSCPYQLNNWLTELEKPERLEDVYIEFCEDEKFPIKRKLDSDECEIPLKQKFNDVPTTETFKTLSEIDDNSMSELPEINPETTDTLQTDKLMVIYKQLLCDYGPRLDQNYKLWIKNSMAIRKFQPEEITENPLNWTVDQVVQYISRIPLCKTVAEIFRREYIDGEALLSLRQTDLTDILNLKLGPTVKIYSQIIHLRAEVIKNFNNDEK